MAQILKLAHFVNHNGMADMQIRCRWIKANFDLQGLARLEFLLQIFDLDDFFCAP